MSYLYGRKHELQLLENLWKKKTPSLVVCRGRRRIGKSRLIQEFGQKGDQFIELQGLAPNSSITAHDQMKNFSESLSAQSNIPHFEPESWNQIFSFVTLACNSSKKTVLFLDEISWMGSKDKTFTAKLKIAWDTEWKKLKNLVVVLCGSVNSWIEENIINNTGFVGRISLELVPKELPLKDCNLFWGSHKTKVNAKEKLQFLSVTGGIPRYLEELDPTSSVEENIKQLCFTKEGMLFHEFERIFHDIFGSRSQVYLSIIESLISSPRNLKEISDSIQMHKSGILTRYLDDLHMSGFIATEYSAIPKSGQLGKSKRYRLQDNYLRFYLKYIKPKKDSILKGLYEKSELQSIVNWDSIAGIQFETLVLNNLKRILELLKIPSSQLISASSFYQKPTKLKQSCQIDLLIYTKHTIYPCEIKLKREIKSTVITEMQNKIAVLKAPSSFSIRPVLIYHGHLANSVQNSDYFNDLIQFDELLQ